MYRFAILLAFAMCERVLALSVDQRQTGDLNVHIDLKNFNVFALSKGKEEYVDYDYAYDYSEMTIKPQNGTTSTTIKPLNTTETTQIDKNNGTTPVELTTKILGTNESDDIINVTTESFITANVSSSTDATTTDATTTANNQTSAILDCKKGFFRNNKGNCELKLQNPSNTLLKMLKQKSKSSGGSGVGKS